jgi:hypothetical protein
VEAAAEVVVAEAAAEAVLPAAEAAAERWPAAEPSYGSRPERSKPPARKWAELHEGDSFITLLREELWLCAWQNFNGAIVRRQLSQKRYNAAWTICCARQRALKNAISGSAASVGSFGLSFIALSPHDKLLASLIAAAARVQICTC